MVVIAESESLVGVGIALPPSRLTTCPLCGSGERVAGFSCTSMPLKGRLPPRPPGVLREES